MKKVVLITGGSRGLGKEIVKKFSKNDYIVIINYNKSEESARKLEEELMNKEEVFLYKADISKEEEVKLMIEKIIKKYKKIDVLINNAGIAIDTTFEDKTEKNFKKILNTNLIGPFLVSKYIAPIMKEQKSGNIINITSTNGIDTYYPESLDYDASKAGLISLTHNLAVHLAPYIRVNAIAAGWMETDMNKDMDEEFKKNEENKILLKRFAHPKEIANVVFFLATEESKYINNEVIRVDGGTIHD